MRRSRVVLSIAAVLTLGAGVVMGRLSARAGAAAVHGGPGGHGWFIDALDLTPDQRKQMDAIWADARGQMAKSADHRHELDKKRDKDVRALMSPEQLAAYDKVWADYHAARASLDLDRDKVMREANDRSKALLTDGQKARWEAMSKDMHDHHDNGHEGGPGGAHDGGPGGRPPPRPPPPHAGGPHH
jgi:Spy/CpxP family protein refolding chaperone